MAGVEVTLTHQDTKAVRTVTTDASGFYRAPTLEIGRYTVEARHPGFKTTMRRDLGLHVNVVLRVDFTLELGAVTEQITVAGTAPVVSTETGEISNIVDSRQMVNLQLNGRVFIQLGMINPGVSQKPYAAAGGFVANGLPSTYVNVQLDSREIMDFADQNGQIGALANFPPSVDSIAEFTMQTSSYRCTVRSPGGRKHQHSEEHRTGFAAGATGRAGAGKGLPSSQHDRGNQFRRSAGLAEESGSIPAED